MTVETTASGRKRRVRNPEAEAPVVAEEAAAAPTEDGDLGSDGPPDPEPEPVEEKAAPKTRSRSRKKKKPATDYGDIKVVGNIDAPPALASTRSSVFDPILEKIIKNSGLKKPKWTVLSPEGRKPNSLQAGLQGRAKDRGIKLTTKVRTTDEGVFVYAIIVPDKSE